MFKTKKIVGSIFAAYSLSSAAMAGTYTNTSYYVAYDDADKTQYALVLPSVQKVYTHKAGDIQNLKQVDADLSTFPTYNNGELCFPALKSGASGDNGASVMAGKCYDVNFFYTQKEKVAAGTAFILYFKPQDKVYEGLAGDAESFKVVKEGTTVNNENSYTNEDYSSFSFDPSSATVVVGESPKTKEDVSGIISSDTTWTADKVYRLNGKVVVNNGATLTIEPGTTVIGKAGTGANSSWLVIDKGSKIMAEGTADKHI
ncbi:MAG TPA: hypothetical protein ENK98_02085, partial [Epsilonproteobacteria bacterium]|nr:hypothetical protein [Campylobacterota bacterium]